MTLRKSSKPSIGDASDQLQLAPIVIDALLYHIILFFTTTPILWIYAYSPFSVHVRMECRLSDRGAPVA
jgi:hypothetical protein